MAGEDDKSEQQQRENRAAQDLGQGDDVTQRGEARNEPGDRQPSDEPKAPVKVSGPFDERRAAMLERAKALRHGGDDPELIDQIAESRANRFDPETPVGGQEGREPPARTETKPADAADAPKRKLIVHGKEVELTEAQVAEHAQKSLAAEGILEAAKAERQQAHEILEAVQKARENQPAPTAETPPAKKAQPATILDDAKMAEIIDKIQVGDPKDAQAALQMYGDAIEQRVLATIGNLDERIAATADTVAENRQRQSATIETLRKFGEDNPDFKGNNRIQAALAQELSDQMRSEMRKIGVEDATIERVQNERKLPPMEAVSHAYRLLQSQGYAVPTHDALLATSVSAIRKDFNLPAPRKATEQPTRVPANPTVDMTERVERKRVLTPQPRRAAPPNPAGEQQERTREESGKRAVAQMKAFRRGR